MLKLTLLACAGSENIEDLITRLPLNSVASRSARVLVAEDDSLCRQLLKGQLNALGYQNVDCVKNGAEALNRCHSCKYEVLITDLGMPLMDGYTLLKRLRADGISIPVIISTADIGVELRSTYNFEVLYKPTTMEQLGLLLKKVLSDDGIASVLKVPAPSPAPMMIELRGLFSDGWTADANVLRYALNTNDTKRLLGLLHRLKGALLVLNERGMSEICDELQVCLKTHEFTSARSGINIFIAKVDSLVKTYQSQP